MKNIPALLVLCSFAFCTHQDGRVEIGEKNFWGKMKGDRDGCRKIKKGNVTYRDCGIISTPGFDKLRGEK